MNIKDTCPYIVSPHQTAPQPDPAPPPEPAQLQMLPLKASVLVCGRPTPDAATEAAAICLTLLPGGLCLPDFWQMIACGVATRRRTTLPGFRPFFYRSKVCFFLCKVLYDVSQNVRNGSVKYNLDLSLTRNAKFRPENSAR